MRFTYQFQDETVKGQGWRRSWAYHVFWTRRTHYLLCKQV